MRAEKTDQPSETMHPSIRRFLSEHPSLGKQTAAKQLDADWLRTVCLDAGADDVGFVPLDHKEVARDKERILKAFPAARSLISIVCRMNPESVRSPARSVANLDFHHTTEDVNDVTRKIVRELAKHEVRAMNPSAGFPMEMNNYGDDQTWVVSHKPVAVAAGLGQMGIHRNVIHPKFGNFIVLGTILIDAEVSAYGKPLDYNPCLSCKLCVAACPVGAIHPDGYFNFSACFTHNYREFMGGFNDWVEQIAESKSREDYREKVSIKESVSMWQSLSFGPNYKAAYCMAVCPAGDDVIGQYLADKKEFLSEVVKPLQKKEETIYVVPKSDAEEYVLKHYPHKSIKRVHSGLSSSSIKGFLRGMRMVFQPGKSKGMNACYHFAFYGAEKIDATVIISNQRVTVSPGHEGKPDLRVDSDSSAWLKFLSNKRYLPIALVTRKIKLTGSPKHLLNFGECFPS
jgi:epoxyqueuosine reductase QueG